MKTNDVPKEVLDQRLAGYSKPEDLTGPDGLLKRRTGALVERALNADLTEHLGYQPHAAECRGSGNSRNGKGKRRSRPSKATSRSMCLATAKARSSPGS